MSKVKDAQRDYVAELYVAVNYLYKFSKAKL